MHKIVILGAGTGGTMMANRLRRRFSEQHADIVVVDQDDRHIYQPGLLFVPFGLYEPEEIVRPRRKQLHSGIQYVQCPIERVDVANNRVHLEDGTTHDYDVLIIATGTQILPAETEGMLDDGWRKSVFDFYTLEGATALRDELREWKGGRLVVNVVDMPIKCPVAPLEFAFLADWFFHDQGIRKDVEIAYVTPLDGAFTRPVATKALHGLLDEKNIELVTEFATGSVDAKAGKIVSFDEREIDFDLLVAVPVHGGAEFVERSEGLGDELNFVPTDKQTLQSLAKPNIFALGDATNLPTSKAGSVTHFEADVMTDNIELFLEDKPLEPKFDGHANCFVETGFGKAMLIDFNYEVEPLPGRYPLAGIGPMPLLKEARINHLGKMMFHWFYWHALLPGRPIPGVPTQMSTSGKHTPT